MRKIIFGLFAMTSICFSSAAFAGPPCNIHVGGLCGSDYDGWMELWHRTNRGHVINPVSPGGYGILPNGQRFYPDGRPVYPTYGYRGREYGGQRFIVRRNERIIQGPVTRGSYTVLVPHPWRRILTPEGWVCTEGPCPHDRVYVR